MYRSEGLAQVSCIYGSWPKGIYFSQTRSQKFTNICESLHEYNKVFVLTSVST